jgi:hypothetical protein
VLFITLEGNITSSSSSSALQPGVGFGLPYYLEGFVTMIVLQGGVAKPTPTPSYFEGPMFSVRVVSLSWLVPI